MKHSINEQNLIEINAEKYAETVKVPNQNPTASKPITLFFPPSILYSYIVTQIYILPAHWIGETQQGNIKKPNWSQHPVSSLPWSSDHKAPVIAATIPDISITGLHSPDAETCKKA